MEELSSCFLSPPPPFLAGAPPARSLTMDSIIQEHSLSGVAVFGMGFGLSEPKNLGGTNARILAFFLGSWDFSLPTESILTPSFSGDGIGPRSSPLTEGSNTPPRATALFFGP